MNNNYNNTDFSQLQWIVFQIFMRNNAFGFFGPSDPSGSQNTSTSAVSDGNGNGGNRWNVDEIEFFDFMYDGKSAVTDNPIEHADKNTYFRNVNDFIDRVKNMIDVKKANMIRQNLYICFREIALVWYTIIFIENQKRLIKLDENVDEWIRALSKRFKKSDSLIIATIKKKSYIMKDDRRRRKFSKYAHVIIKTAKFIVMNVYSQLWLIYNDLNIEFRRDVRKSIEHIDLNVFLQEMKNVKEIWWNLSVKNSRDYADNNRSANNFREQQQGSYDNRSENEESLSQKDYDNDFDYEYPSADSQQQPRQTQFFITYQFNNLSYQNRTYQNQSNYRQQSRSSQTEADQSFVRSLTQSPFQGQSYRSAEFMPSNSFQSRNAFDLQFKSQQSPQSYRSPEGGYLDNQYQNRPLYEQRFNASVMQQRAYLVEDDFEYYNEEVFQKDQKYYYDDDSFQQLEEQSEEVFHDQQKHVFHEQHQLEQKHIFHEQSPKNEFDDVADVPNDIDVRFFFIEAPKFKHSCRRCDEIFFFNNKLHYHLKRCKKLTFNAKVFDSSKSKASRNFSKIKIIRSSASIDSTSRFDFKFWRYVKLKVNINFTKSDDLIIICIDSDCEFSLIDRQCLVAQRSNYVVHVLRKSEILKINDINAASLFINEYISLNFVISDELNDKSAKACFIRYLYIVNDLKVNIFLNNDILESKNMFVHVDKEKLFVDSCGNFVASLKIIARDDDDERVKRTIRSQVSIFVPTHSCTIVLIKYREFKLPNRDLIFNFNDVERLSKKGGVFSHIVDVNFSFVQVKNTTDQSIFLCKNERLDILIEYEKKDCYLVSSEIRHLNAGFWIKKVLKLKVVVLAVFFGMTSTSNSIATVASASSITSTISVTSKTSASSTISQEYVTFSDITVYDISFVVQAIAAIAKVFLNLWKNDDFIVNLPSDEWMFIILQSDAKLTPSKIYSMNQTDKNFIDKEFDKFQQQGKLKFIFQSTSFSYSVFVIWRIIHRSNESSKRKDRVVVDIRDLNKITELNIYLMSLQTDIIALVVDCSYIFVFDAISFFHQWLIRVIDKHKLIVISHRNQKQFNVVVMRFKNFSIYVQRKIDAILRVYRVFVKIYVDDIVIFSKTLKKHLIHLRKIFQLLNSYNIRLSFKKSFLKYFIVVLLKQKIDAFEFTIIVDKLIVIINLRFSYIFKNFEKYLDFTEWLRNYIIWYAQKTKSLQIRKILLLRNSSTNKKRQRKMYSIKIVLKKFFESELKIYRQLQKVFRKIILLIHHDFTRVTYINVDVFKRRDFDVVIYHLKFETNFNHLKHEKIESIFFFSRMLTSIEKRYWSTKLKMTKLIWIVRRVRHFIKVSQHDIVVFTDHVVNASIAKQIILSFSNIDKLNFRLMRASIYLFQFRLNIRYRFDKRHVISNVLFRLSTDKFFLDENENLNLKSYHDDMKNSFVNDQRLAYNDAFVSMFAVFRQQLIDDYVKKKTWTNLIAMLISLSKRLKLKKSSQQKKVIINSSSDVVRQQSKAARQQSKAVNRRFFEKRKDNISQSVKVFNVEDFDIEVFDNKFKKIYIDIVFEIDDELIYHIDERRHLCISAACEQKVFRMTHDENQHSGRHRCYQRIVDTLYVFRLSRKLRLYIEHCSSCQLNQIKRHRLYEKLISIFSSSKSFHIIIMNFVVELSDIYDALLTVIDKFFRRVLTVRNKTIYDVVEWAHLLLKRLLIVDWDISKTIISNKDFKFLFDFWQIIFKRLKIAMLINTAYHSQINDDFERINQMIEIVFRYLITIYSNVNWFVFLSVLQTQLNNFLNVAIGLSLNEVIYDFKVRDALIVIDASQVSKNIFSQRLKYQQKIADATAFVNAKIKIYYDVRHQSILFRSDDRVYLRLHQVYKFSDSHNRKMFNQRCEFFIIKRRTERLVYELDLSTHWRVYSIIFVTQLEPCSNEKDSYRRLRSDYSNFVEIEGDTDDWRFYTMEKIIDKRLKKFGRITVTQYMVKWLGYGPEYNEWRSLSYLNNCLELVEEYEQRVATTEGLPKPAATPPAAAIPATQPAAAAAVAPVKQGRGRPRKVRWWKPSTGRGLLHGYVYVASIPVRTLVFFPFR